MATHSLPDLRYPGSFRQRALGTLRAAILAVRLAALALVVAVSGPLVRGYVSRTRARGGTVWLDRLTFGRRAAPGHRPSRADTADMTPRTGPPTRVSRVLRRDSHPEPIYPFAWRRPPVSGNVVNGLGGTDRCRARKVFHVNDYTSPWGGLEFYFHNTGGFAPFRWGLISRWRNRHQDGPVAPNRLRVEDPEAATEAVRRAALDAGAVLVGVTELGPHHVFEGTDLPHRYAVSMAVPMDREVMRSVPSTEATHEVMKTYVGVGDVGLALARRIRAAGWPAVAVTDIGVDSSQVVLHVPIAVDAGLGQLGKHGSLITRDHGSNVRLTTVLTDLPLAVDVPRDLGVDDFCANCQICVTNCPPHAILDTKQLVRGVSKWYVDFDTCVPYFSENGGCGICIEVCPWSEPGRGPVISEKMLSRREKADRRPEE